MKHHFRILLALLTGMVMASCNRNGGVKITQQFDEEIEVQQNLVFSFDKDICPDSLLNRWDSTALMNISPAVKGYFKWTTASELVFSPEKGFKPGTSYTAEATASQLFHWSGKSYPLANSTFHFHTAALRVTETHVYWTRGAEGNNAVVQMDLTFNYEINISEAKKKITLSSKGNRIMTNDPASGNSKTLTLQFAPLTNLDETTPLDIKVDKNIPLAAGMEVNSGDTTIKTEVPSRFNLSVTDISAEHSGSQGIITVNTSQPVVEATLKAAIKLEPEVKFDVTLTDGGFIITSPDFSATRAYQLYIDKRMEGVFGGKLKANYEDQVHFGKIPPSITFQNSKGMYLSTQGMKNLALRIVNVPKVQVWVTKVYDNNLESLMRDGIRYGYHYDDETEDGTDYEHYNTENIGDTIFSKLYTTDKLPKQNEMAILHLDFSDKLKGYDGVYIITVASTDNKWIQHSKLVSLSDIGLIVKEDNDNMYVFANSIKKGTPLSNVKISFISNTNQRINSITTDGDGMAAFKDISKTGHGFKIAMVSAKMGDEFSFVWLEQARVETSRFDVGGRTPSPVNLNAWIYPERNLYRPGETIHVSTIVRNEQWGNPGSMPVKMKLVMPNGKEFATHKHLLNAEGSCETSYPLPPTAMSGTYSVEVYSGNDVLLSGYTLSVENFIPDRIKVQLKTDRPEYRTGDSIQATIQADNLFGTPAANRKYECLLNVAKVEFQTDAFSSYNFAISNRGDVDFPVHTGSTSATGAAPEGFKIPATLTNCGMYKGNMTATVFDETGRPVHRYQPITVYTQKVFIGIDATTDYVSTGVPLHLKMVGVDKNGAPQNEVPVHATLIKKEWHTVIEQDYSRFRYVSQKTEKVLSEQDLMLSGIKTFTTTPALSGEYELRVYLTGTDHYVSHTFYAYGFNNTEYSSFEVNTEGNVTIKTDKDKYKKGDNMNILFTTPFEGRMLVTVERNRIMKHFYLSTKNRTASLSLKADDECVPNIYVSATLYRPMAASDMPLTVAHGIKSISVENPDNHLPVAVTIAEKSRSKTQQVITVKTTPGALVTIAAVDEGILQVKNFETPDVYNYFYQKVALSTNSYDIYPFLLPEINTRRTSTGGDGSNESSMRANPLFVNRVKNVSFWSGIVQANSSGLVKYTVDIPQFSGDLRVMAVAYKGKAFGSTDKHMKVADPIIISTALPRFMSPNDQVSMSVTLSNTTAKEAQVSVTAAVTGQLAITGNTTQMVTIRANSEQRVVYLLSALPAIGTGKVLVTAKGLGETLTNETEMSIRPTASLQKTYNAGTASAGATTSISLANDYIPATMRGKLVVAASPLVQFTKNLSNLVNYPYGCVEQTTSAVFPQLYYADLVKSATGTASADPNINYNIQSAILKLQSMQLSDGALSYWPDGGKESWWGSVYATHFLLEARKNGYDVNPHTLDRLMHYLTGKLAKKETEILYYNQNLKKEIAAKEIPYSLYVLAMAGQPDLPAMNYYKAHQELLAIDGKYLLAAAFAKAGMPEKARQVLPPAFAGEVAANANDGSFYSYTRDMGLALFAMMDIDPNNQQVGTLSRMLATQLNTAPYLNTQENVFGILAMGRIARNANANQATAEVLVNGKVMATTKGASTTVNLAEAGSGNVQVRVKGSGAFYYFSEISGISATGKIKLEDSYIKVRRSYYTRDGKPVTNGHFTQSQLIVVKLTIVSSVLPVENVAITDMLPAGFEIENTRLNHYGNASWINDATDADYTDIRDDRINIFTTADVKPKNFYYMVRAVSPGTFQLGPVQADAMYNGAYHSYFGSGVITITE